MFQTAKIGIIKKEVIEILDLNLKCGKTFEISQVEADHILPWSKGGKTVLQNCQILCKNCNRRKGNA